LGANVSLVFENVFKLWSFFWGGGPNKCWDGENQLFWELYGPLLYRPT